MAASSGDSPGSTFIMRIRRALQVLMSRPGELGERRVRSAEMQSDRNLHGRHSWLDGGRWRMSNRRRYTEEELDARLKFVIGCILGSVLLTTTIAILYALIFVTQPIGAQAENDKMFFGVLSNVATFITGTLAGLMIQGRGKRSQGEESQPSETEE